MSEFMREALPIIFMYGVVVLLGPFIAFAMWMAFDGDRLREEDSAANVLAATAANDIVIDDAPSPHPRLIA